MFDFRCSLKILRSAALVLAAVSYPQNAYAVSTADEICPSDANPCTITETVTVDDGAVLDFGSRKLRIVGNGRLMVGASIAEILCGELEIARTGKAIDLGTQALGGELTIEVLGRCTTGPQLPCMIDAPCVAFAGVCDVDTANAHIAGGIDGNSSNTGIFSLSAAGNVTVISDISLSAANQNGFGGTILIDAGGDLTVNAKISATSGSSAGGGTIELDTSGDAEISAEIDARGGDFDGGAVAVTTTGELHLTAPVNASATASGGLGGEILLTAGTDLRCDGGTPSVRQLLTVDGSGSGEGFGGDGGVLTLKAGRDLTLGSFVRLRSRGAAPDGFGGELELSANRNMSLAADIQANARGGIGGGGLLDIEAGEALMLGGSIDLDGGSSGSSGDMLVVGKDLTLSGSVFVAGEPFITEPTSINITGCNIDLTSSASWENATEGCVTTFTVLNEITAATGAEIAATQNGANEIHQRSATLAPSVVAAFSPAPIVIVDEDLPECARCGDGEVGAGESCDDGNMTPGDGCGDTCQLEACIAQTPGWPGAPLCNDGLDCTLDLCDVATEACVHLTDCDDGTHCTSDSCGSDGNCTHSPSDALCEDGNPCTNGICTSASGCFQFSREDEPCDDGLTCTANDTCGDSLCSGEPLCAVGEICLPMVDTCGPTTTTLPPSTTTSSTTTTTISGSTCGDGIVTDGEACDSGMPWAPGHNCRNDCTTVDCGDPNDSRNLAASDALFILLAAVGAETCDCTCDVDDNTLITASDALRVLRAAVGVPISLACSCA